MTYVNRKKYTSQIHRSMCLHGCCEHCKSHSFASPVSMRVFNLELPDKPLTNFELSAYARELGIPHFRDVFMTDTLPRQTPHSVERGIADLNTPIW